MRAYHHILTNVAVFTKDTFGLVARVPKENSENVKKELQNCGAKEVEVERSVGGLAELVDLLRKLFAGQHRRGQRTEAAGFGYRDGHGNAARPGHRGLHDEQLDSEPGAQLTADEHPRTLRANTP